MSQRILDDIDKLKVTMTVKHLGGNPFCDHSPEEWMEHAKISRKSEILEAVAWPQR